MNITNDQLRYTLNMLREERENLSKPVERLTRAIEAIEDIIDRDIKC